MRILAAVVVALVAIAACGGGDESDEETLDALVAFARDPSDETWSQLPLAETVRLGLGEQLMERHAARELRDPRAWLIEARLFRAGVGPFSPLEPLSDTRELEYGEGRYMRCASPLPGAPPSEVASLRRLNIQPREWESCLQWFAVDVFVTGDGEIAAVTLDYFEP